MTKSKSQVLRIGKEGKERKKKKKSTALCGNWNWKSERVPLRSKMEEGKWPLRKRVEEPFMSLRVLCSAR